WFFTYPLGKKRVIFEREQSDWRFGSTVSSRQTAVLEELTRDNALFLSLASRVHLAEAMPMYLWFQHSLAFALPGKTTIDPEELDDWLDEAPIRRRQLTALLRAADLGITDIRVEDPVAESEVPRIQVVRPELSFLHGPQAIALGLHDQSHGTRAWLNLLFAALKALEGGTTLFVDEVDSSLHPRLTARLVELFKSPETNNSQAQLVFTTHDPTLLGSSFGQDILDRDEIWFVDKDSGGATTLYPLTDFHPRKEESTQRRYLGGSYGAVPNVSEYEFRRAVLDDSEVA
ncbi:MAG: uncharacterized protein QOE61_2350, partial [Micromonosporaceae bacterium]|nr:uncharacterized protein [Micromonosporaceae bacterium]